jgi:septum formation protein
MTANNPLTEMLAEKKIYLASASPRRAQILSLLGLKFAILPSEIDEESVFSDNPVQHVLYLSRAKAEKVALQIPEGLVIGADTIVVLDGSILGKPADGKDACAMLQRLSNRRHQVFTGFTIIDKPGGRVLSDFEVTSVQFRKLAKWEIEAYVATGHSMDKAGAYGIQDESAVFSDRIEGCFYNVVGFPVTKFYLSLYELQK